MHASAPPSATLSQLVAQLPNCCATPARHPSGSGCGRQAADKKRFPLLPAYDHVLKCSNLFNTLDARGAISVTERVGVIQRVRRLAVGVAQAWVDQQQEVAELAAAEVAE